MPKTRYASLTDRLRVQHVRNTSYGTVAKACLAHGDNVSSPLRTECDSFLAHDSAGSVFGSWSTRHIRLQPTGRGNDAGILIFNNSPPAAGDVPRGSSVASLLGAEVQRLPPDFDPLGSVLKLCHEGYDEDIHLRSVLP